MRVAPIATAQSRVTLVPSVSISSFYDDNLFTTTVRDGDQVTQLRPSLEASLESPKTTFQGLYWFDMQRSAHHPAWNSVEARRHAFVDAKVRSTPALTLGIASRYDKAEAPGDLNLESGLLGERRRAQRWQVTPTLYYRARPRTSGYGFGAPTLSVPGSLDRSGSVNLERIYGGVVDVQVGRQYDVAPDGRFLINLELDSAAAPITLLMNWRPEAKK